MQTVLACTDGSEAAERAVRFFGPLAATKGCDLTVFGVTSEGAAPDATEAAVARAVSLFAEAGVAATTRVAVSEDRADEILKASEDYDLVVLGVSGRSHMRRFLMGSVPLKVLAHSPASVMIVK